MTDDVKSGPLPGAAGGPDIPSRDIPGGGATDTGRPGAGGTAACSPFPIRPAFRANRPRAKARTRAISRPGPDQAFNDIKKGSR